MRSPFLCVLVGLLAETIYHAEGLARPHSSHSTSKTTSIKNNDDPDPTLNRRNFMALGISSAVLLGTSKNGDAARAFPNKISDKYDDRPKRRGPQVRASRETRVRVKRVRSSLWICLQFIRSLCFCFAAISIVAASLKTLVWRHERIWSEMSTKA